MTETVQLKFYHQENWDYSFSANKIYHIIREAFNKT